MEMGVGISEVLVERGAHEVANEQIGGILVGFQFVLLVLRGHRQIYNIALLISKQEERPSRSIKSYGRPMICSNNFIGTAMMKSSQKKIDFLLTLPKSIKAHLFPKSQRFSPSKAQCPEAFYNNTSQLTHKATNFGYGKRLEINHQHSNRESPASNKYNTLPAFGRNRGCSFGCSRQVSQKFSYINPELKNLPGPGEYETGLSPRTLLLSQNKTISLFDKKQPFPYIQGQRFVSKYKSTKYGTIDPNAKRFPEIKVSPGPTDYSHEDSSKFVSGYIVSSFRGAGSRHFDREARFTHDHWKVGETPGPGKYLG